MKRVFFLLIIILLTGVTKSLSNNTTIAKDSLLKALSIQPADTSRLKTLHSLAYLDLMSPSCVYYSEKLLKEATEQNNKEYQCIAMYVYVLYYFNHQDEKNTIFWMDKLSKIALEYKFHNLYFLGKRAEITMHILKRKIEYSITEAEKMYKLAGQLENLQGMYSAKLCLMYAYLMTARYKEGLNAGMEAYHQVSDIASSEIRVSVLQEIALACFSAKDNNLLKYLELYKKALDEANQKKDKLQNYNNGYLLLASLYADYYLETGELNKARIQLKEMDKYFSPTSYIPCRGLYYSVYSHYYRSIGRYNKALEYSDTAIRLLSEVSDNDGLNYKIERAGILTDAGRADEAIPLYQELLAKKDSFYSALSTSQMDEIYQMRKIDDLLLEKEQYKTTIHYTGLALIAIALITLIPFTFRIYNVRKRLKKEEEEIRRMSLIAEEANEVKSRFLANMSYNIRIQLNNVLGFSQLLSADTNSMDTSEWKEYSNIIQSNSTELIQLVNDVLDLSRLEAGRTKWQIQDHDIIPLCSDILCMVHMKCANKIHIGFQTEIKGQPFQADISRFTQVLLSTLIYSEPCDKERTVSFSLYCDKEKEFLVFHIVNSPLADPKLQTQKTEVRNSINRLTIMYFGGTYTVEPNHATEGSVIHFTYPYSKINQDSV